MLFATGYPHITILGTTHVWDDALFALDAASTTAFDAAQRLVFEHDSRVQADLSMVLYHPAETLQTAIAPDLFSRTVELWLRLGFPAENLPLLKPWYVEHIVTFALLADAGLAPPSVDQRLFERAVGSCKRIERLEATEDVLAYLDSVPRAEQERSLAEVVAHPEREVAATRGRLRAFRQGDRAVFAADLAERMEALPHTYDGLVTQRNAVWADRIKRDFVDDGIPTLIIVGGLHGAGLVDELKPTATP